MKRIIFSLYTENVLEHTSVPDYKRSQFRKFKHKLIEAQKNYARVCNADYEVFDTSNNDYDEIQFEKIIKIEELTQQYDEVLYLDFDIVPRTDVSFFNKFNLDEICVYSIPVDLPEKQLKFRTQDNNWHAMDMYSKMCAKNAMLLLNDINGKKECVNTGVVGMNKNSVENLRFSERFSYCIDTFREAKNDNLYPVEISSVWKPNNEVFVSFLIEMYNVPFCNIGLPWNFILDHVTRTRSAGSYMIHQVNKEFDVSFEK